MRKSYSHSVILLAFVLVFGILSIRGVMAQCTNDSTFLTSSRPIVFRVNTTDICPEDAQWITDSLIPKLQNSGPNSILLGRSAASPEGPFLNNRRLAAGRYKAICDFLKQQGFDSSRIQFEVADEDYLMLVEMMRIRHDADYDNVRRIVTRHEGDFDAIKTELMDIYNGTLWNRLLRDYFPFLRAVHIMVYDLNQFKIKPLDSDPFDVRIVKVPQPDLVLWKPEADLYQQPHTLYRREMFAVKTNLLEWGAYVPQYGWCPMPNIELEYYPRHGHWTFGATFDCPWWVGNTNNHKYFELHNYQLYSRYYLRNSDLSYSDKQLLSPIQGQAAFRGFYLQAYAQAFLYQIGFSAQKGWIGEGFGGGLGLGYVVPLTRDGHWRLDFGVQLGVFVTKYDPFIYGCPVEKIDDGLYYYDYTGDADMFKKREYSLTWIGPTRIGISISYDLFYRPNHRKGISLRKKETVWDR